MLTMREILNGALGLLNDPGVKWFETFYTVSHFPRVWRGTLQVHETSDIYTVRVEYDFKFPRVYVENPKLRPDAPYRYSDGRLGLFYPPDGSWAWWRSIKRRIIPWTAEYLCFYEIWLETDTWYGLATGPANSFWVHNDLGPTVLDVPNGAA